MIARFHVRVHHTDPTTVVPVIIGRTSAGTTGPAELVAAEAAGHVITARGLLNPALAAGALAHFVLVLLHPEPELLANRIVAADIFSVPEILTGEADLCAASRANQLLHLIILRSDVSLTVGLGAPADQRVSLKLLLFQEALVLFEQFDLTGAL